MTKAQPSRKRQELKQFSATASLTQAELSFQRGDYTNARDLLKHRIQRGVDDFRTRNLLGISLANLGQFDEAEELFLQFKNQAKGRPQKDKAIFNLGLNRFFKDLSRYGDMSVTATLEATPTRNDQVLFPMGEPFLSAIETWKPLTRGKSPYQDHGNTFLSFAYLQFGDLDQALHHIANAIANNENFFLAQYVLGRLFLDLFWLANEGNDYLLPKDVAAFFEVEEEELIRTHGERVAVQAYTYLDIALQAFMAARSQAPTAIVVLNYLCQTFMLADMYEEAREALTVTESLAPDWLSTLNLSLKFHESIQAPPDVIRALVKRIEIARRQDPIRRIFEVIPPHYLV